MKLEIEGSAAWPKDFEVKTLRYADENAPDRLGWREVVVRPAREWSSRATSRRSTEAAS